MKGPVLQGFLYLVFQTVFLSAQQSREYNDGHGGKIRLPHGDISFADKIVSYRAGNPAPIEENRKPALALGIPDFNLERVSGFVSLGTRGELILSFSDNALVNISGPDLYVFEVGRYVEETFLHVSKDGRNWKSVGKISGGNALVDIGDSTRPGEIFTYVKLVDAGSASAKGDKMWPGADIDAVAAIGSAKQISLSALYVFDTGQSKIRTAAKRQLDTIIGELRMNRGFKIVINGHTDSTGTKSNNLKLSADRANAIKNYLVSKLPELKESISVNGYADEQPVGSNATPEGREKNRRVEIFFLPVTTE